MVDIRALKKKKVKPVKKETAKTPAPGIEPGSQKVPEKHKISTESALQDQVDGWELTKYDLLEKLNIVKWQQRNMARIWKLQKNQIFKKLNVLDSNIAVVRKQIKSMEDKMPEEEDKEKEKEEDKSEDDSDKEEDKEEDKKESDESEDKSE